MTDTPPDVDQLFSRFIMAKSVTERFRMGFEMMRDGRRIVECSINRQYSDWPEADRQVAVFERFYRGDFSEDELERIKISLREYYERKNSSL